jgi:hypothetical protein
MSYFESFIFRPGNCLYHDDDISSRPSNTFRYPDERDLDTKSVPRSDIPHHLVVDLEELAKLNIRDQSAQLHLPTEASIVSIDLQQFALQKVALPLIAEFNKVCPHPGNHFNFVTQPERLQFVSMITTAPILPTLEYFVQFSVSDLMSIYCTLIDEFTAELLSFNIFPDNDVHLTWMLRARGFSLQYGLSHLSN